MIKLKKLSIIIGVIICFATHLAAAQVVVVPLGGADVDPQLLPIAGGDIGIGSDFTGGFGITSVNNSSAGVYQILLNQNPGATPIVLITSFGSSAEITNYTNSGSTITAHIFDPSGVPTNSFFSIIVYANSSAAAKTSINEPNKEELDNAATNNRD